MSIISENNLFKICIEQPIRIQKDLNQLNLQFINDPKIKDLGENNQNSKESSEVLERKAIRLYQMIWSGLTKSLQNLIHSHNKAVAIPGFGTLGPHIEKWATLSNPLNKGPISTKDSGIQRTVIAALNEDFIQKANLQLDCDSSSCLNQNSREEQLFGNQTMNLNTSKIASVCLTDSATVELMLQEFFEQIIERSKNQSLRINFKVGILQIKSGGFTTYIQPSQPIYNKNCQTDVTDYESKVSVITPSFFSFERNSIKSKMTKHLHVSNPNPQPAVQSKFRSINQIGQQGPKDELEKRMLEYQRFGKKVIIDQKMTTQELVQKHQKDMNEQQSLLNKSHYQKQLERDFIDNQKRQDDIREAERQFYILKMRKEVANFNKISQSNTSSVEKIKCDNNYFPFVSNEIAEEHRKHISAQIRSEINQYMTRNQNQEQKSDRFLKSKSDLNSNQGQSFRSSLFNEGILTDSQTKHSYIQKVTPNVIRTIFDSCYLRPEENPRVIKDSDPVKLQVIQQASGRHERALSEFSKRKEVIEQQMKEKAQKSLEILNQSKRVLMDMKMHTKEELMLQSNEKKQQESNKFYRTSFGPQEPQVEYELRLQQKRDQNLKLQCELQEMIDMKNQIRIKERQQKLANEMHVISQTQEFQKGELNRKNNQRMIDVKVFEQSRVY